MTYDDFDITFCNGKTQYEKDGVTITKECPVRDRCRRFWTENHAKECVRLGCIYNSFFMLTGEDTIGENGCDDFWEKE